MFESVYHNRTRVGEEEHLGLTCWRYEWVQTNYPSVHPPPADVEVPTVKAQALILADDSFPLLMRVGSDGVWDSKSDVLELTLDVPVPAGFCEPPADPHQSSPQSISQEIACDAANPPSVNAFRVLVLPASSFRQCWRCWPGLRCSNPRKTRLKWVRLLKPHA
jgi:hypothetical protein